MNNIPLSIIFILTVSTYLLIKIDLSKTLNVFLTTFVATGALVYIPSMKFVNWIYDRRFVFLLELRASDKGVKLYKFPIEAWKNVEVKKGELFKASCDNKDVFVCQRFLENDFVAYGTWRGSASSLELLRDKEKILEVRNKLEEMAKRGMSLRARFLSIVRGSVNEIAQEMAKESEKDLLFCGEKIDEIIEEQLEESEIYE